MGWMVGEGIVSQVLKVARAMECTIRRNKEGGSLAGTAILRPSRQNIHKCFIHRMNAEGSQDIKNSAHTGKAMWNR